MIVSCLVPTVRFDLIIPVIITVIVGHAVVKLVVSKE